MKRYEYQGTIEVELDDEPVKVEVDATLLYGDQEDSPDLEMGTLGYDKPYNAWQCLRIKEKVQDYLMDHQEIFWPVDNSGLDDDGEDRHFDPTA